MWHWEMRSPESSILGENLAPSVFLDKLFGFLASVLLPIKWGQGTNFMGLS